MKTWRTLSRTSIFLIAAAFLLVYASGRAAATEKTYPNARMLVETGWLAEHLDDPSVRLVDVRSAEGYAAGHIKNAVNIPIRPNLSATIDGVRGMVAPPEVVQEALSKAGIDRETHVIAYDASGGLWAARLLWILQNY
jgi:thiosulfate/3-mercaptopyruvate sulfurtransferase